MKQITITTTQKDFGRVLAQYHRRHHIEDRPDRVAQNFARYLRAQRQRIQLTQPALADRANLPIKTIVALENGLLPSEHINESLLTSLAKGLDISTQRLGLIVGRKIECKSVAQQWMERVRGLASSVYLRVISLMIVIVMLLPASTSTAANTCRVVEQMDTMIVSTDVSMVYPCSIGHPSLPVGWAHGFYAVFLLLAIYWMLLYLVLEHLITKQASALSHQGHLLEQCVTVGGLIMQPMVDVLHPYCRTMQRVWSACIERMSFDLQPTLKYSFVCVLILCELGLIYAILHHANDTQMSSEQLPTHRHDNEFIGRPTSHNIQESGISVSIPDNITGYSGGQFTIPVEISSDVTGEGILAYAFTVTYDPMIRLQSISQADTMSDKWSITLNRDSDQARIVGFSDTPITGTGSLLNLTFDVSPSATSGAETDIAFSEFRFNEGEIVTQTQAGHVTVVTQQTSIVGCVTSNPLGFVQRDTFLSAQDWVATIGVNGCYITGVELGYYVATPTKTGTISDSINVWDAIQVALYDVQAESDFSDHQLTICDVTENGMCTAFDAAQIALYRVNSSLTDAMLGQFVSEPNTLTHLFLGGGDSLVNKHNELYIASDVTLDWPTPEQRLIILAAGKRKTSNNLSLITYGQNMPVSVQSVTEKGLLGYEMHMSFDPEILIDNDVSFGVDITVNPQKQTMNNVKINSFLYAIPSKDGITLNVQSEEIEGIAGELVRQTSLANSGPYLIGLWNGTYSDTTQAYVATIPGFSPEFDINGTISMTLTQNEEDDMDGKGIDNYISYLPASTYMWGWDTDGSYGDWYGGHELIHNYGRCHALACFTEYKTNSETIELSWTVNDMDNDVLYFIAQYNPNTGQTWEVVTPYVTAQANTTTTESNNIKFYFSSKLGNIVSNEQFTDENIFAFNPKTTTILHDLNEIKKVIYFDGSDVGLRSNIKTISILNSNILFPLNRPYTIQDITYNDSDIIIFTAIPLGQQTRSGIDLAAIIVVSKFLTRINTKCITPNRVLTEFTQYQQFLCKKPALDSPPAQGLGGNQCGDAYRNTHYRMFMHMRRN